MRIRVIVALACLVFAVIFGFAGRSSGAEMLFTLSGLLLVVAVVAGIASLSFWAKILPPIPEMPGLFDKPGTGQRWCGRCGSVALAEAACDTCGHQPPVKVPREKKAKPDKAGAGAKAAKPAASKQAKRAPAKRVTKKP